MNDANYLDEYDPVELIKIKFIELKDSPIGKYFFLYFLHLSGMLNYKEDQDQCTYSKDDTIFTVPLPVIDSEEKYIELQRVHKNLEKFFTFLKTKIEDFETIEIQLIDI